MSRSTESHSGIYKKMLISTKKRREREGMESKLPEIKHLFYVNGTICTLPPPPDDCADTIVFPNPLPSSCVRLQLLH